MHVYNYKTRVISKNPLTQLINNNKTSYSKLVGFRHRNFKHLNI